MNSLILRIATRFMLPLLLLFSVFLLLRGHNSPGGGFSGGLVAASAFVLYSFAFGVPETRRALIAEPRALLAVGLLIALASGIVSMLAGKAFLTGIWDKITVGDISIDLGTPLCFDIGVYLVVIGFTLSIILPLAEEN